MTMEKKRKTLAEEYPEIAKEWHPQKNGDLTPDRVAPFSNKKVWWLLPYEDPETGKHYDFDWEATINDRTHGRGCPYLTGQAVWSGYNDLQTRYPDLAREWHPQKNGDLTPDRVVSCSSKKVWWLLPYDDPETGKHHDFEWEASISQRTGGRGCPYLTGQAVWSGYNDLQTRYPDLAKEWHPQKNGELTPDKVALYSNKKVWWLLPYDDPETGKHHDFEWEALISERARGKGCPYLSVQAVWSGYNDLQTRYPEIAKEWHPQKNGELTPDKVAPYSKKKVWWLLPYEDPETGKHYDFEWEVSIVSRTRGNGCPYLTGHAVWSGYNDLQTRYPEIAKEWHPQKNGDLTPDRVVPFSNKKVWWLLPYDDPETGKHHDFEWEASINHRAQERGCPYLTGHAVWLGYNDLQTRYPEIAKEWHPQKNGELTPDRVVPFSNKKVWWLLPYDDPETGKHHDFEWEASIVSRTGGNGCPYLTGRGVWPGYNDLQTRYPEIAREWHPQKNGDLSPQNVTCGSTKEVWWLLPYDDPETGKHHDFEWKASIASRTGGNGCPYLTGPAVWSGYNDLQTRYPDLAKEWHPTKNRKLTPQNVAHGSNKKVWWICEICGNEWRAIVASRTYMGSTCPKCARK